MLVLCAVASPAGNPATTARPAVAARAGRSAHREFFIHSPRSATTESPGTSLPATLLGPSNRPFRRTGGTLISDVAGASHVALGREKPRAVTKLKPAFRTGRGRQGADAAGPGRPSTPASGGGPARATEPAAPRGVYLNDANRPPHLPDLRGPVRSAPRRLPDLP